MSDNPIYRLIRTKRAIRKFTDQPLPADVIREILDAGRLSESSKNDQPWTFIAITNRDTLTRLSQTGDYAGHLAGAAFAVAIVGKADTYTKYEFDFGRAAQNMMLTAHGRGIGSVIASIYHPDQARAILGFPADTTCETAISFGYPAEKIDQPPRKGGRRPFEDVVRWEKW